MGRFLSICITRNCAIKKIFTSKPLLALRLLFFLSLAVTCMIFDRNSESFHEFRVKADVIVYPVQIMVNGPLQFFHDMANTFSAHQDLIKDNAQLRAHQILLQSKLQKLIMLENENKQLRKLLSSASKIPGKVAVASLLAVDMNPAVQQIILDKGKSSEVYNGQPVLDAYGVMGQVVDVGFNTSKILMLTDTHSAVPVQDERNGLRAVVIGMGRKDQLNVINVSAESDVQRGDVFVTSGLGLRYPVGYPVGKVQDIIQHPGQPFLEIVLRPAAHMNQTQNVLLAWPDHQVYGHEVKGLLKRSLPNATKSAANKHQGSKV